MTLRRNLGRLVYASVALALALASAPACGVEPPCPAADLAPLDDEPAWAVVTSDYESTAVALLDADGEPITEAWLDSGTVEPGIATALTGDVVLPTDAVPGQLVLLDRFGVDVVTRISLPDGRVLDQLPTQLARDDSPSGFRANPHDVLRLDDGRFLIGRSEPNPNTSAPPLDAGNDLVIVDPAAGELAGRIALDAADVPDDDGTRWARPDRMTRVGARIAVGLGRLSTDWEAAGGAVAIVDPTATPPEVEVVALDGLADCGLVRAEPDAPRRVVVLCAGDPFAPGTLDASTTARRRERAGIARLAVDPGAATRVQDVWRAADHPDGPVPSGSLVALGGGRVAFAAMGDTREDRPDQVFVADLATRDTRLVLESEPFAIGTGAYDAGSGLLLLPDASSGVRRVAVGEGLSVEELPGVDPSPCRGLAAREVARVLPPP